MISRRAFLQGSVASIATAAAAPLLPAIRSPFLMVGGTNDSLLGKSMYVVGDSIDDGMHASAESLQLLQAKWNAFWAVTDEIINMPTSEFKPGHAWPLDEPSEICDRRLVHQGNNPKIRSKGADKMSKAFTASEIIDALKQGKDFAIPGVGKIKVIQKAARVGRNPRTGENVNIPAQKTIKLSISSTLKEALNAG